MNDRITDLAQRIGQVEADVLEAADALAGFGATDLDTVREDLARAMRDVFLDGEEAKLRAAAADLAAIFDELRELAG